MSKRINKGVELLILLLVLFSLIGCSTVNLGLITSDSDDVAIQAIADKAKVAIENKDVSMFMSIISQDYSDIYGGTYDSIYTMAQNMVDEIGMLRLNSLFQFLRWLEFFNNITFRIGYF